jgi:hypothetical protein
MDKKITFKRDQLNPANRLTPKELAKATGGQVMFGDEYHIGDTVTFDCVVCGGEHQFVCVAVHDVDSDIVTFRCCDCNKGLGLYDEYDDAWYYDNVDHTYGR